MYQLRDEIEQQLGADLIPREYVFVKSVGRSLTRVGITNILCCCFQRSHLWSRKSLSTQAGLFCFHETAQRILYLYFWNSWIHHIQLLKFSFCTAVFNNMLGLFSYIIDCFARASPQRYCSMIGLHGWFATAYLYLAPAKLLSLIATKRMSKFTWCSGLFLEVTLRSSLRTQQQLLGSLLLIQLNEQ